ncbi:MAG: GWxTD domain-containing protein, partial [bacterium]
MISATSHLLFPRLSCSRHNLILQLFLFATCSHLTLYAQPTRSSIDSLTTIAKRQLASGEIDSAKDSFKAALDFDKKDNAALMGLGEAYFAEKDWAPARDAFVKVLRATPDNLDAHYYAAISYRELGKTRAWVMRFDDWRNARKHFQAVTAADSLFKDILYQFSILEEYDKEFEHALELAHAGLRLRKELVEPQMGLFNLYNHFICVTDTETSSTWLRSHPSSFARYFSGELFRINERPDDARNIFESMLRTDTIVPRQAILLSLVRLKVFAGDTSSAERLYWQAVEEVHSPVGTALIFEDLKYIMSDEELHTYNSLSSVERKLSFFRAFWNIRNPIAGSSTNDRLIEHYRRMLYAEKNHAYFWFHNKFNGADWRAALHFPESYSLNQRFSDRGLIYVRHGPPNQIERAAGIGLTDLFVDDISTRELLIQTSHHESRDSSLSKWSDPNESWVYFETPESPRWIFNFVLSDGNWRLAPLPTDRRMYEALASWDPRYGRLSSSVQFEQMNTGATLTEVSRDNVSI